MQIFIFVGSDNFSGYFCADSEAEYFSGSLGGAQSSDCP